MRSTTLGRWAAGLLLTAAALFAAPVRAACPSYTRASSGNTKGCAVDAAKGTNPTVAEWQTLFGVIADGPVAWGDSGPPVKAIRRGCDRPTPAGEVAASYPCILLKAIAMQESLWTHFCAPDLPADQVGQSSQTIIAFDCGYGIAQVTTGMRNGETPSYDRARVAADPLYNLATGAMILADKWRATRCVGDALPETLEHWYNATWAYNGLAYINNPNNPVHSSVRGVWNARVGGSAPYQEKVFGRAENPRTTEHWPSVALAYPDPTQIGTGAPPALAEPHCASPTDCVNRRPTHRTTCNGSTANEPPPDTQTQQAVEVPALASDLELGPARGCGCGAGSPAELSWMVLVGSLAAFTLRRRQRRGA